MIVIARNAQQPSSRWYSGAGIYRPVTMYVFPKDHILLNGVKIKTIAIDVPRVEVDIKTTSAGTLTIDICQGDNLISREQIDTDGHLVHQFSIPNGQLWSIENPCLYHLHVKFKDDFQAISFGIRDISYDAQNGFCLNRKRVILKGACIHHDQGLLGVASHPYADERKIKLLKEAGFNAIRSAHNPISKASLDACDKLGMLVMDEYADMWYIHKTRYDYADQLLDWYPQDLQDMIDKDYNHPSVIMYSIGNEVAESSEKRGLSLIKNMKEIIRSLDSTRPVTCGINIFSIIFSHSALVYTAIKKPIKGRKLVVPFSINWLVYLAIKR